MDDGIHEECGIAAVHLKGNGDSANKALFYLYKILLNLQNRGQLSAGISTFNPQRRQLIDTYRNIGTVNEVFKTSISRESIDLFKRYSGKIGIGHVRYATFGKAERMYAQPFERHHGRLWKWFSFGFNGNLVNYYDLKSELENKREYHFILDNDTEIIMHYISRQLAGNKKPDLLNVFANLMKRFEGSFNISFLNALGELVVSRDPHGFRPLTYGMKDGNLLVASESNALVNCGYENFKSLKPGHMIHMENGSMKIQKCVNCPKKAHCMFEWVYFSNVSSVIDDRSVYLTRTRLGKELARNESEDVNQDYIVVPVPDSAKAAGDAYAYELGLPAREGLIRNRFVGRTFIEGNSREDKIQNKYTIVREVLKGKKILLVDDSIVRGATTEALVQNLKTKGGAKEVHVRVSCPPIMGPCFYGIDMSTVGELIAPKFMKHPEDVMPDDVAQRMAKHLGADSITYQSMHGLIKSIGLPRKELCTACLDWDYPTETGKRFFNAALASFKSGKRGKGRTYEMQSRCGC